jgi:hypothetical protein
MTSAQNKLCKATVDGSGGTTLDVFFRSNILLYGDSTIGTATGITPATAAADAGQPAMDINSLIRVGYLYRVVVTLKGTSTNPSQQRAMLCSNKKLESFKTWANAGTAALPGGGTVIRGGLRMNRMRLE